jgi:hypothetical protein
MATISHAFTINGIGPMLMHNGQTADTLNQFAKAMKKLSGKRNKTDEDHEALSRLEWWAGLYTDKRLSVDAETCEVTAQKGTRLVLPAHLLDSCLREGARKIKAGKQISAGVVVEGDAALTVPGFSVEKASGDDRFLHRCAVRVGTAKIMRTRPILPDWSACFSVCVDVSVCDVELVKQSLENAGRLVGIGDWRPGAPRGGSYGRFVVA